MNVRFDPAELFALTPVMWVAGTAIACLLGDLLLKGRSKTPLAWTALTGLGAALYFMTQEWSGPVERILLGGSVAISSFGFAVGLGLIIAAAMTALSAAQYGRGTAVATGEFYGLVLFATAGAMVLAIANDLVTLFVALEVLSISVYALTGISRGRPTSAEGAMKYFVLGAAASGFLLYGIALLYGAAGTMQIFAAAGEGPLSIGLAQPAEPMRAPLALTGVFCLLVGFLFKIGAVPFHGWVADAYEGAPAPSTGFMSVAVKAAAFAALFKIVVAVALGAGAPIGLEASLSIVAMLTMLVGNFGALMQDNPKRLLAYSGIAHTGYALVAVAAVAAAAESPDGAVDRVVMANCAGGLLFYLLAYGVTNLSAFAILCSVERDGKDIERTAQLAGLAKRSPLAGVALLVTMISLAGVPLTGGFVAKVWVFQAGLREGMLGLVLLGLLTSVVSLYYYLKVVMAAWMVDEEGAGAALPESLEGRWAARLAMVAGLLGTLWLGLLPSPAMALMQGGAEALFAH